MVESGPAAYARLTPYLIAGALDLYAKACGAKELARFPVPDAKMPRRVAAMASGGQSG